MPLIRYTHGPDIREHGEDPIVVPDTSARYLTAMRRAVLVTEDELAELSKAKLAEVAGEVGAQVSPRDAKGHFVKAITEAQESK